MNRPTDGHILLVGEGNFSLSASLVEDGTFGGPQLISSCFETYTAVQETHPLAASNIEILEKAGGTVLFEVDATDLHNHPEINFFHFERVIFNFPLADRHNIKKNRALLSDFFSSVKNILDSDKGQVMVTLCKGQGGTPADRPLRSWHNSWQVVSMAANAGFILTEIHPFQVEEFSRYKSVGFRFQDKGFNTDNALIHVFETARSVAVPQVSASQSFIPQGEEQFVVPSYIRRKHDRWSLLDKKDHPVCTLHHHFVARLSHGFPQVTVLPCNPASLPKVLPGYTSSLHATPCQDDDTDMEREIQQADTEPILEMGAGDAGHSVATSKDLKDLKNLEKVAAGLQASGGAVGSDSTALSPALQETVCAPGIARTDDKVRQSFRHGIERGNVVNDHGGGLPSVDIDADSAVSCPGFNCNVYVVHKLSQSTTSGKSHVSAASEQTVEKSMDFEHDGCAGSMDTETMEATETVLPSGQSPSADILFHLRSSLLENLPHLLDLLKTKSLTSVLMSGAVFRKCRISPSELPVCHETVIVGESETENIDDMANQLCAALKAVFDSDTAAGIKTKVSSTCVSIGDKTKITLCAALQLETKGTQKRVTLGHVFLMDTQQLADMNGTCQPLTAGHSSRYLIGAILYLDTIACHALCLPDARLLWSEDVRFLSQFYQGSRPLASLTTFKPFSLYPVRFVHDVSFWENPNRLFDEQEFLDVVREVADDYVNSACLVDKFDNAEMGKTSRCYRLVFVSYDHALSYIMSWKLQSVLRLKVAHSLGVVLR